MVSFKRGEHTHTHAHSQMPKPTCLDLIFIFVATLSVSVYLGNNWVQECVRPVSEAVCVSDR